MISKLLLILFHLNYETRYPFEAVDSRFPLKDPDYDSNIERITEIFYNKHILDQLNSTKLSIFDKLSIIENEQILGSVSSNLYKAGLFDDWDFEI
tara:strand:- start:453 stop:737 length:285 start_codon:yes stop_codon:yes gene_type:complete